MDINSEIVEEFEAEHHIQAARPVDLEECPKIAVAVGKSQSSSHALKWVLDNVELPGGLVHLVHVQAPIHYIPTPMGNNVPIDQVSEDVVNEHKLKRFMETEKLLSQYKKMCDDRQVTSEVCCSEGIVQRELVDQISNLCIAKLVLGTSSQNKITKALKGPSISSYVVKHAPEFCTVMVVCKGKLQMVKDAKHPLST